MYVLAIVDSWQLLVLPLLGVAAGVFGGLFGVGGGLVMIPAMLLVFGSEFGPNSIHLYKLASLVSSVVVAVPATARQIRARALVPRMLVGIVPLGSIGVIVGVVLASYLSGERAHYLGRIFGAFMILVVAAQLLQRRWMASRESSLRPYGPVPSRWMLIGSVVGLPAGFISGVLGIAGGVWAVPAQNVLLAVGLRSAIANSTAMIVFLAAIASVVQSVAVSRMDGVAVVTGWYLALWLGPGALVGGWCGAALSHRIPVAVLRDAFYAIIVITGIRLLVAG